VQEGLPSKGLIRNDFSPEAIADIYGHYATAISVLTDEKFFQGISPSCPGYAAASSSRCSARTS
jgi:indole-3-glycerol phosphate synthase